MPGRTPGKSISTNEDLSIQQPRNGFRKGKVLFLALVAAAMAVGCSPSDQQTAIDQTQTAYNGAVKSAQEAWKTVSDQAGKLDMKDTKAQLEQMKTKMTQLASQASRTSQDEAQAAQDEWQRLDLAEHVKDLQKDSEDKLKEMNAAKDSMSKDLDAANKAYADAQEKLNQAQTAYDEATHRAQAAWNALSGK